MNQPIDIGTLLKLRKITRTVSDELRTSLRSHLATLAPLLMSRQVLGRHADGNAQHSFRGEDDAFSEVVQQYEQIARSPSFALPTEIESPLGIRQTGLDICAAEYVHKASAGDQAKDLTIISPLRWVLFPSGCSPNELRELMAAASSSSSDLKQMVLQYLALNVLLSKRPNIVAVFAGLRFPINMGKLTGCGDLPIVFVESPIATIRADDEVIIQSTELTGTDTFEEVVDQNAVENMVDPLRARVTSLMA